MKRLLLTLAAAVCLSLYSQAVQIGNSDLSQIDINLWPVEHPADNPCELKEGVMFVFPAPKDTNSHRAVLICPGGGYSRYSMNNEGFDWVSYFHSQGMTVAVLKYTLPHGNPALPGRDAAQAMRILKERSAQWQVNPDSIGVMGFSAGGHLAATLTTTKDASVRPAFSILYYPVISMQKGLTHTRSHNELMTDSATLATEIEYSNELRVDGNTPPTIIFHSNTDHTVSPLNSIAFYTAMLKAERQCTLHLYPTGRHGWGFRSTFQYHDQMLAELTRWLNTSLLKTDTTPEPLKK